MYIQAIPTVVVKTSVSIGDDISTTFTFLAGWEWEKTSTFIKCNIVEISSFKNPPDKRVMIVLTPGLRLTQCAVNFEPKMEPGIGTVEYAGCNVNPWECTINPHVLQPDFNFQQAVDRSKPNTMAYLPNTCKIRRCWKMLSRN